MTWPHYRDVPGLDFGSRGVGDSLDGMIAAWWRAAMEAFWKLRSTVFRGFRKQANG